MEATTTATRASLHPLVATAAVAVIIASAAAVAAMTGLLPPGAARPAEPALAVQALAAPVPVATPAPQPVATAPAAPEPAQVVKAVPKPAPKPKPVVHHAPAPQPEPVQVASSAVPASGSYPAVPPDFNPAVAQATSPAPVPALATLAMAKPACADCGVVESMREVEKKGEGTGAGAMAGGMGGLILGKQVGRGTGNTVATILGAVGGAYAGHQIEKNVRSATAYEVGVRMSDGTYRTISMAHPPSWRSGDPVRVVNGALQGDFR